MPLRSCDRLCQASSHEAEVALGAAGCYATVLDAKSDGASPPVSRIGSRRTENCLRMSLATVTATHGSRQRCRALAF